MSNASKEASLRAPTRDELRKRGQEALARQDQHGPCRRPVVRWAAGLEPSEGVEVGIIPPDLPVIQQIGMARRWEAQRGYWFPRGADGEYMRQEVEGFSAPCLCGQRDREIAQQMRRERVARR